MDSNQLASVDDRIMTLILTVSKIMLNVPLANMLAALLLNSFMCYLSTVAEVIVIVIYLFVS